MQMVLLENLVKFHWIGDKLDETMKKKNKCTVISLLKSGNKFLCL